MFAHIFSYRLKCLLRNREMIFWTLMFPLALATFLQLAVGNIGKAAESFQPIPIALVEESDLPKDEAFKAVVQGVSKGDGRLFDLTIASNSEADALLADHKIKGYVLMESPARIVVNQSGTSQKILRNFVSSYLQQSSAVTTLITKNPANLVAVHDSAGGWKEYTREVSPTKAAPDNRLVYFFALIAMACMYGGFLGSNEVTDIQADISARAARINVAPVHKLKTFLSSACASLLVLFVEMLVLLLYLTFALSVDFGPKAGWILLTVFVGSASGISFGAVISALVKKGEGIKTAVLISATMLGATLSGLMFADIKYVIAQYAPLLSWVNPMNLIADAFYSLYYFDTLTRYAANMAALCGMTALFCAVTYFSVRRKKYASL